MSVNQTLFRQVLGRFATGITVVTVRNGEVQRGMTANAFTAVSLHPPLVLVSVDKQTDMHRLLMESEAFCVNILAEHRRAWSDWWSGKAAKAQDQFATIPYTTKATGSPVLDDCLGSIDCRIWARYDGGDHTLIVGEVQEAMLNDDPHLKPLLFFASQYRKLADEPL